MASPNDLFLFAYQLYQTGGGSFGKQTDKSFISSGFAEIGTAIIHITNAQEDPWNWNYTEYLIPFTNATLNIAAAAAIEDDIVYIVGLNIRAQVLARIQLSFMNEQF